MNMDMQAQKQWVEGLRTGDEATFDQVYDHFRARLFSFLLRMTLRQDVAEDLLQETFLRLASHGDRLREDSHLSAWLYTVARNLAMSYHRRCFLDQERVGELGRLGFEAGVGPFEALAVNELQARVEGILARLPAKYREALLLAGAEGFTPLEAAEICGIKADAFRQRLSRARAMLKQRLDKGSATSLTPQEVLS